MQVVHSIRYRMQQQRGVTQGAMRIKDPPPQPPLPPSGRGGAIKIFSYPRAHFVSDASWMVFISRSPAFNQQALQPVKHDYINYLKGRSPAFNQQALQLRITGLPATEFRSPTFNQQALQLN